MSKKETRFFYAECDWCGERFSQEVRYEPTGTRDEVSFDYESPLILALQGHHDNNLGHNLYRLFDKHIQEIHLDDLKQSVGFAIISSQGLPQGAIDD